MKKSQIKQIIRESLLEDDPRNLKLPLEGLDQDVINDIHQGFYALSDAFNGGLKSSLMKAAQQNPAWEEEFQLFIDIRDKFNESKIGSTL